MSSKIVSNEFTDFNKASAMLITVYMLPSAPEMFPDNRSSTNSGATN